ncbi:MAG: hypothetical protein RI897_2137 [Verrucomicrobiota bacterium]
MTCHVYILQLQNNRLYVGSTSNLNRRLAEHRSGSGSHATSKSPPSNLIYSETFPDHHSALLRERQLKRWSHAKRLALAEGRLNDLKHLAQPPRNPPKPGCS